MQEEVKNRESAFAESYGVDSRTSKKQMQEAFLDNFGPSQISAFSYFDYYIRLKRQFEYDKHAYFGWVKGVGIVRYTTRFVSQREYFCTFKLRLGDSIDDYDDGLHEYVDELPRHRGKQCEDDWDMDNPANCDVVVVDLQRYAKGVKPKILNFLFSCVDVSQLKVGTSEMTLDQITVCINMMYVFEEYISVNDEKDVLKVCVMRAINLLKRYHREKFKKVYHNLERLDFMDRMDSIDHYFRSEELDRIRNKISNNNRPALEDTPDGDGADNNEEKNQSSPLPQTTLVTPTKHPLREMSRLRF
jgi:hypothetical protein